MVVIGSPSSSGSGASTTRRVNGCSWPCWPPRFFRTASRVFVTLPLSVLVAEAGQHQIAGVLLAPGAAGAGFLVLAEMVDAQHEAAERLCDRLQHVHHGLAGCRVVLVACLRVAGAGRDRVDDDRARAAARIPPAANRRPAAPSRSASWPRPSAAAGVVSYQRNGIRSTPPHLSRTTASSRSRTSSAPSAAISSTPHCRLTGGPETAARCQCRRARSKRNEGLAGAPLARQQAMPDGRHQLFDQPRLSGRGFGSPCA